MTMFTATFSGVAVTAAQDVFQITAPAGSRVLLRECKIGQYTDFGDAAAEILSVLVMRGHATTGSNGSTVTPSNLRSGGRAADSAVLANNTTVASTGSPATLVADTFNIAAGWSLRDALAVHRDAVPPESIEIAAGERLVVRITAPADSLTMNGTLVFEEVGA